MRCCARRADWSTRRSAPLYEAVTKRIVEHCVDVWVYNTVELRGVSKRVRNVRFCPVGSGGEMRWIQLG